VECIIIDDTVYITIYHIENFKHVLATQIIKHASKSKRQDK